jgi:predicted ATPase
MSQIQLWHESIEDAIGTAVQALGGAKKVAELLWPVQARNKPQTAYTRLRHCLNAEKPEKLDPDEVMTIARAAAVLGEHSIMKFFARELGYELVPLAPTESVKRMRRNRRLALLEELKLLEDEE